MLPCGPLARKASLFHDFISVIHSKYFAGNDLTQPDAFGTRWPAGF